MTNYEKVKQFHRVMNMYYSDEPKVPEEDIKQLRVDLLTEEYEELLEAVRRNDLHDIAKELSDLLYVVYGLADTYGLNADKAFHMVHESNLSKIGIDGKVRRRKDGKVLKPDTYRPANLEDLFNV